MLHDKLRLKDVRVIDVRLNGLILLKLDGFY